MKIELSKYGEEVQTGAKLCSQIMSFNFEAYIVGGCVRDMVMGNTNIHDVDIATNMPIDLLKTHFNCADNNGEKHGTILIKYAGFVFEVTQFRTDGDYSDGRHPDKVSFTSSLKEDMARRDFTINAMAINHLGLLIDYFGGEEDLQSLTLRTVGDSKQRFDEDGLRILRAIRFASRFKMEIHKDTWNGIIKKKDNLKKIARERIGDELYKTAQYGKDAFTRMIQLIVNLHIDNVIDSQQILDWRFALTLLNNVKEERDTKFLFAVLFYNCKDLKEAIKMFRFDNDLYKTLKFVYDNINVFTDIETAKDLDKQLQVYTHKDFNTLNNMMILLQKNYLHETERKEFDILVKNVWCDNKMLSEVLLEYGNVNGKDFGSVLKMLRNTYYLYYRHYNEKISKEQIIETVKKFFGENICKREK